MKLYLLSADLRVTARRLMLLIEKNIARTPRRNLFSAERSLFLPARSSEELG